VSRQKRQKVKDQKYLIGRLLVKGVKHRIFRIFNCWDIEERTGEIILSKETLGQKTVGIFKKNWDMMSKRLNT
jgi:hypothetical protein